MPFSWMMVLILFGALFIRVINLGAESAWVDEGYSIALAQHSIPEIIQGTAADQHPPLYYLLLHSWMWLGSDVVYVRLFSVLLGVFNVYQVMSFGKRLGGEALALKASLLVAINPMHVWYSQEARQYMLLAVLTTAASIVFWECLKGKRRWLEYGIFSLLAIYTQYFAFFVLLAQFMIVIAWTIWQKNKRLLICWFATILGVGALFLAWLPEMFNQFLYHPTPWIEIPERSEILGILLRLVFGSGVLILPEWIQWLGMIGATIVLIWTVRRIIFQRNDLAVPILFLMMSVLVPYVVISAISFFYPIFQFKQFLIILVPLLILVVIIADLFPRPWKSLAFICLLIIPIFSLVYQQVTLSKDDWRGMAAYIDENMESEDVLFSNPAAAYLALNLYLQNAQNESGYPPDYDILTGGWKGEAVTEESVEQSLMNLVSDSKRIWLIEFFPEFWDPDGLITTWLENHALKLNEHWFGNISLQLYYLDQVIP